MEVLPRREKESMPHLLLSAEKERASSPRRQHQRPHEIASAGELGRSIRDCSRVRRIKNFQDEVQEMVFPNPCPPSAVFPAPRPKPTTPRRRWDLTARLTLLPRPDKQLAPRHDHRRRPRAEPLYAAWHLCLRQADSCLHVLAPRTPSSTYPLGSNVRLCLPCR